jgi:hypothetical protein
MKAVKQKHIADNRREQNLKRQRGSYHIIARHSPATHATEKLDVLKQKHGSKSECT